MEDRDFDDFIKKLKNGIEQMKRDVVKKNCKDEEIDFWMNRMETPVIKLIDKLVKELKGGNQDGKQNRNTRLK